MNIILQKAIMNLSRLLNRYRKGKTEASRSAYKRQRRFCVKLLRKTKKEFYNKLNAKYINENKLFWKTAKPSLADKTERRKNYLSWKQQNCFRSKQISRNFQQIFWRYCSKSRTDGLTNTSSDNDAVTIRQDIEKYQNHPSIKVIRENINATNNFWSDLINPECMSKIINKLDTSKATQQGDIPTKINNDELIN